MQVVKSLAEIEALIQEHGKVAVRLQYVERNVVRLSYLTEMKLRLVQVEPQGALFRYELGWAAGLLAAGAKRLVGRDIKTIKMRWDADKQEIWLNLGALKELREILQTHELADMCIEDGLMKLDFRAKG